MKMIAFMKYGEKAASTRQRLLQFVPELEAAGIKVEWFPLLGDGQINQTGRLRNTAPIMAAYLRRVLALLRAQQYDLVWIHKELFPYTPGWFEGLIGRMGIPVVYDFDDAIFHNYDLSRRPLVRQLLGRRFEPLLRRVSAVSCGNAYLWDYAARFCPNSVVIPTVVDTDGYRPRSPAPDAGPPVIGWIGSHSTWSYVEPLVPMLEALVVEGRARVRIVGSGVAAADLPAFEMIDWTEATEIAEVQAMDIGIMPLTDDPWSRGKCGYKLIQYMACGLPVVASPVGVNVDLAQPGVNGMLAETVEEWRGALVSLLEDETLRAAYGRAGRERVERDFSLKAHAPRFIALLQSAVADKQDGQPRP
ncbi:glycosyltransferase family 4 protein [Sphingomonas sp. PL-96]|uniref:glycosyltransferase family 4 protein n=1 Tax=Sphingomonas sp. PL-96 TaxID=2887201 RepID=UPI001E527570|nr:glycosyltransferase family 4 protein [Sphingomonas sp. PL-96]MCC2978181.1 glycosyltransferase family 4 protein [Sphingomonas sp. PL-96]